MFGLEDLKIGEGKCSYCGMRMNLSQVRDHEKMCMKGHKKEISKESNMENENEFEGINLLSKEERQFILSLLSRVKQAETSELTQIEGLLSAYRQALLKIFEAEEE